MIESVHLRDFKSFSGDAPLIPLAPVTLLVGANASGKSNVLDAFRFLQGIGLRFSMDEAIREAWVAGIPRFPGVRGGAAEVCWRREASFTIQTTWRDAATADASVAPLSHRMTIDVQSKFAVGSVGLHSEALYAGEELLFGAQVELVPGTRTPGVTLKATFKRSTTASEPEAVALYPVTFPFCWRLDPPPPSMHISVVDAMRTVRTNYANLRFLNLHPTDMRRYVGINTSEVGERGENLSGVVYQVCQDEARKKQLVDWLSALCAPEVADLDFDRTTTDEVLLRLIERDGTVISGRAISDGTLRFLGYLAAFYSVPENSVFLLEEIENGLHPTRVHLLVELMEQFAEARNIQFIATTHSPQALLALSNKALRDVILFARPEGSEGTVTERLGNLPHFDEVSKHTDIDELFSTGWMEHAL